MTKYWTRRTGEPVERFPKDLSQKSRSFSLHNLLGPLLRGKSTHSVLVLILSVLFTKVNCAKKRPERVFL